MIRSIARPALLVLALLWAAPVQARPSLIEKAGDDIQIILPAVAAVCAFGLRDLGDYAIRLAANLAVAHGSKNLLGDAKINLRPSGGDKGFPSGHTTVAFQGASYLARDCVGNLPWARAAVFGAAVFVGGSRIEAGAHFLFQVVAGALLGLASDRLFRRKRRPATRPNRLRLIGRKIRDRVASRKSGPR